jgi:hypothetical protein
MRMPVFGIERQNPVCILPRFDRIAEPKMGGQRGEVRDDQ